MDQDFEYYYYDKSINWPMLSKEDWEVFNDMMTNRFDVNDIIMPIIFNNEEHPMTQLR